MSIPNILSIFRIVLIPVFIISYIIFADTNSLIPAGVLLLSGFTDMADGFIARKFNMITYLGKILDPLADKLTMLAVMFTLASKYRPILYVGIILVIKELLMTLGGIIIIKGKKKIQSSKWFGKFSTTLLYAILLLTILLPFSNNKIYAIFAIIMCSTIILALILYIPVFIKIYSNKYKTPTA